MDAYTPTAPWHDRTRLLLVDTDNLFLDDVGRTLQANQDVDVVGSVRCIGDAFDSAFRHCPDVIVISWGVASRAFVHAAVETLDSPRGKPLVVIVLPGDITSTPGLRALSLMPNVALVVNTQLEKLVRRHAALASSAAIN